MIAIIGKFLLTRVVQYKWIIVAGAMVGIALGGYRVGYKVADGACEESRRKALEAMIEYQNEIRTENDQINEEIIKDLRDQEEKIRIEIREVTRYVENNPDLDRCELDARGLSIWNGESSD